MRSSNVFELDGMLKTKGSLDRLRRMC
uniref:Uncharacterized protein n=1 Tax=Arundo donax TaxID=35708 RepID=A0A0A8Z0R8_ARUDO